MLAWKIAPALAAGNTVVLKPAETTPLTALLFCDVAPPGRAAAGRRQHRHRRRPHRRRARRRRASTRSRSPARPRSARRSSGGSPARGKKLTLELGGKAANIVFDDAALDQAVEGIVNGIYFNQGHVCCAGSRLLVQESIAEPAGREAEAAHGDAARRRPARQEHRRRRDQLARRSSRRSRSSSPSGSDEGAEIYQPPCRLPEKGYWFAPTVFTNVAQSYRIAQEEIFGPVLSVLTFRTPDEAVEKANNTPYGLSAGVWTEKGSRILWMAERLRAGVVWANTFNRFDPTIPFGGYKESGFGREGGRHGLEPYLRFDE